MRQIKKQFRRRKEMDTNGDKEAYRALMDALIKAEEFVRWLKEKIKIYEE